MLCYTQCIKWLCSRSDYSDALTAIERDRERDCWSTVYSIVLQYVQSVLRLRSVYICSVFMSSWMY
jgi:hypothetical protein